MAPGAGEVSAAGGVCSRCDCRPAVVRVAGSSDPSGELSSESDTLHSNNIVFQEPGDTRSLRSFLYCCCSSTFKNCVVLPVAIKIEP